MIDIKAFPYMCFVRFDLVHKEPFLRYNSSLPLRLNEFAILITAQQWGAQVEWIAHHPLARYYTMLAMVLNVAQQPLPNGVPPPLPALK